MCIKVTMAYVCRCWRSESGIGSPGALVTGVYEPPDMGAGNCIWVLWKTASALNC